MTITYIVAISCSENQEKKIVTFRTNATILLPFKLVCCPARCFFQYMLYFSEKCMFYMTYRTSTAIVVIWSCLRTMMALTLRRFFLLIALQRSADEVVGSKEPWSHHFKGPALQMEWIQVFPQFQKNPQQIYFWHHCIMTKHFKIIYCNGER